MPRRILQGTVESAKCDKTISVRVERRFRDPLYQKTVKRSTKYAAHDPEGKYKEGDKVNANVLAATKDVESEAFGELYNVGNGVNYSIREIAKMIGHPSIHIAPRPGEARTSLANNQKLRKTFGWEPTVKVEDWIKENL